MALFVNYLMAVVVETVMTIMMVFGKGPCTSTTTITTTYTLQLLLLLVAMVVLPSMVGAASSSAEQKV